MFMTRLLRVGRSLMFQKKFSERMDFEDSSSALRRDPFGGLLFAVSFSLHTKAPNKCSEVFQGQSINEIATLKLSLLTLDCFLSNNSQGPFPFSQLFLLRSIHECME